jgi:hypothetical protein
MPQVNSLIRQHQFNLGLILFVIANRYHEQELDEFRVLTGLMAKLAIVSSACLQYPRFLKLIAENFCDYHTLPLIRLACSSPWATLAKSQD